MKIKQPAEHAAPNAQSDQVRRLEWLYKTAPRPAGMGGAFTAVPGDPIGMWWNPSAAMFSQRLAVSGTHSLRHFPGDRKNLDQFDSDLMGVTIPLANRHMLGLGFTVPGEWGIDYADTNGVLHRCEKCAGSEPPCTPSRTRGRERRMALGNIHTAKQNQGLSAAELASNWYRTETAGRDRTWREFQHGGGFSFFYQADNGFSYGVSIRAKGRRQPDTGGRKKAVIDITLGVAYREDPFGDTLAALDIQMLVDRSLQHADWRYYVGVERKYRDKAFARVGLMHGKATYGLGARSAHLRLDYAVVRDFLPDVAGQDPGRFKDGHFLSYTLTE